MFGNFFIALVGDECLMLRERDKFGRLLGVVFDDIRQKDSIFPGLAVSGVLLRFNQVLKNQLNGVECKSIRIIRGKCRNVCFDSVGQDVHSGVGRNTFRDSHDEVRINDCDIRCQFIICQRILDAGFLGSDSSTAARARVRCASSPASDMDLTMLSTSS